MKATVTGPATGDLCARLAAIFGRASHGRATVAVWQHNRGIALAATDGDRDDRPVPCGCLAKLFTAALVDQAVLEGRIDLDCRLTAYLPSTRRATTCAPATVRQLLEHRHGLDDSLLAAPPRDRSGMIDADTLVASLERRLFEPGTLYSYSNAGAWLCAAMLEALYGEPYASLLTEWAAARGIELGVASHAGSVCPALGGCLSASLPALLRFARLQCARLRVYARPSPLPGWNPLEQGIDRAFKVYGGGWFGHQSTRPDASAWLRIHPARRMAVVIESGRHSAALVGLRLFGARMPGFAPSRPPQSAGRRIAPPRAGLFATRASRVEVVAARGTADALRWGRRAAPLRAAPGGVFYTEAPAPRTFPFVQFVYASDGSGPFLWNGRQIFAPIAQ